MRVVAAGCRVHLRIFGECQEKKIRGFAAQTAGFFTIKIAQQYPADGCHESAYFPADPVLKKIFKKMYLTLDSFLLRVYITSHRRNSPLRRKNPDL